MTRPIADLQVAQSAEQAKSAKAAQLRSVDGVVSTRVPETGTTIEGIVIREALSNLQIDTFSATVFQVSVTSSPGQISAGEVSKERMESGTGGVGWGVQVGVAVGVGVCVGWGVQVGVAVRVGVCVGWGVRVGVAVRVEVEVGASVATIPVAVGVGRGVAVVATVAVDSGRGAGEGVSGGSRKIAGSVQATVVTRRIIGGNRRVLDKRFIFIKASPFFAASNTCAE